MAEHFIRSEQARKRADERKQAQETKVLADKAETARRLLVLSKGCGIVTLEGTKTNHFLRGLEASFSRKAFDKRLLLLDAQTTIQGEDLGYECAEDILSQVSQHRRDHRAHHGNSAIVFLNFNFIGDLSTGTPHITERIRKLIVGQQDRRRSRNHDPAVLLIGPGDITLLPSHPDYDPLAHIGPGAHPIGRLIVPRLVLNHENELSTFVDPRLSK